MLFSAECTLTLMGSTKKGTSTWRPRKLNAEARAFIEDQMQKDDETTSRVIQKKLARRGVVVHPSTVWRSRKQQGWTLQWMRYCWLIRDANKVKRLEFAQKQCHFYWWMLSFPGTVKLALVYQWKEKLHFEWDKIVPRPFLHQIFINFLL